MGQVCETGEGQIDALFKGFQVHRISNKILVTFIISLNGDVSLADVYGEGGGEGRKEGRKEGGREVEEEEIEEKNNM